ncbi:MAG TPA: Lrp/AsnC family transcriptional regulator [Thermoplasmata archaeon]|jgi:DNA-binding Lrp family transcriptional regulator|nr:Lrp/AsnC family transcriptional regulator [Thermoplasmata archaeon]HIH29023.1 Lrp/AsnC family transcriptional regulator [Thermoplasmata archaeon]
MDELDEKILGILNEDARKSYREIARELNVSLTTVSNRIKRMEDDQVIERYIPLLNQEKMGYDLTAVINVKISHGKLLEVQQRISKDKHVSGVYDITGEWDSLIIAHFKDRRDLNGFIKGVLSMDNVEKTNTQIVLNIVKNEKRVLK